MQDPLFHRWRRKDVYRYEAGVKLMDERRNSEIEKKQVSKKKKNVAKKDGRRI
jgi:hypothetical protein